MATITIADGKFKVESPYETADINAMRKEVAGSVALTDITTLPEVFPVKTATRWFDGKKYVFSIDEVSDELTCSVYDDKDDFLHRLGKFGTYIMYALFLFPELTENG